MIHFENFQFVETQAELVTTRLEWYGTIAWSWMSSCKRDYLPCPHLYKKKKKVSVVGVSQGFFLMCLGSIHVFLSNIQFLPIFLSLIWFVRMSGGTVVEHTVLFRIPIS